MKKTPLVVLFLLLASNAFTGEKVVLISGASQGLGKATAKAFSEKGWKVWAGYRNQTPDLEEENIRTILLDVTNEEMIQKAIDTILQEEGHIDVLVNNAAYGLIGLEECVSIKKAKELFDVNFFGALRLIQAVVPSMEKRKSGHIINISGTSGIRALPGLGLHAASKFALEGLSEAFAATLSPWNIQVVIVEPGLIKNDFAQHAVVDIPPNTHLLANFPLTLVDKLISRSKEGQDPLEIGHQIVEIAETTKPDLRYQTSPEAKTLAQKKFTDPSGNLLRKEQISFFETLSFIKRV